MGQGTAAGRPRRRGWITMVVLLGIAVLGALLQRPGVEPTTALDEQVPVSIAHGGASGHAPEDSLPAFERALELGADVLETNVQLSADGVPVLIHDGTVDRTTDGTGRVADLTLEELKTLEVGHDFAGPDGDFAFVGQGVPIPTLDELFAAFPDEWMIVELKTDSGPGVVPAVADLIVEHGRQDRTIVASFDLDYLREFRQLLPEVPTNMPEGESRTFHILQMVGAHRWWSPPGEFLHVPIDFDGLRVVTPGFVSAADDRGLQAQIWTVNDPEEMHWLLNLGVHGIMTDFPDRLQAVLAERAAAEQERADPSTHPGLDVVQRVQLEFPQLTDVMAAITWLGDEEFYVLAFPLLFWAVSRRVGIRLAVVFLLSASVNAIAKLVAHTPRPSFVDPSVGLRHETTFGVPSGHAQNAVVVWGYLAAVIRRWWAWVAATVLMLALGYSRWQLGVHFPLDTVVGWALGAVLLLAFLRWQEPVGRWIAGLTPRRQVWLGFGVSALLIIAGVAVRLLFLGWELPASWIGVDPAEPPMQISSIVTPAATLFGLAAGLVFAAERGGFSSDGPLWQRLARIPVGLVGVAVLWFGLGELFPDGEDAIALLYRYLRYASVGMWVAGLAPILFVRLRLAPPAGEAPRRATRP